MTDATETKTMSDEDRAHEISAEKWEGAYGRAMLNSLIVKAFAAVRADERERCTALWMEELQRGIKTASDREKIMAACVIFSVLDKLDRK